MREEILALFGKFRRRHLWVRAWDLFLEAAFVMTVAAGAMLLVDRLAFELGMAEPHLSTPGRVGIILGSTLVLAAAVAAAALALRPTPPAEIAWRLDRAAGGEERFLSALEVAARGDGGPFAPALCRDAAEVARRVPPARVLPRAPVGYRWGILLSLAAGTVLYAYPPQTHDAPRADFDASPLRGPAPLEVVFRDASIGAIDEFQWEFGDGRRASGEQAAHVYESPGVFTAVLTLRGPGGSSRKSATIEVLSPDRALADFVAEPLKGRTPLSVRFTNLSKNARRFAWDFGDGTKSSEAEPGHVYERPGLYTVRLRAENDLGHDDKVRERYIKAAHPDEPLADFRGIPREGEAPLEVSFEDLSSGALSEWHWDFGDPRAPVTGFSTARNPVHTYTAPGHYTVRLRVKGPHGEDEEEKVRYIHVKSDGGGKGQGQSPKKDPKAASPPDPKRPGGAGDQEGRLFSDPSARPKVKLMPEGVRSHKPGEDLIEKDLRVSAPPREGSGKAEEVPLQSVLPQYRRAMEDSIERERLPPVLRDLARRYYEILGRR